MNVGLGQASSDRGVGYSAVYEASQSQSLINDSHENGLSENIDISGDLQIEDQQNQQNPTNSPLKSIHFHAASEGDVSPNNCPGTNVRSSARYVSGPAARCMRGWLSCPQKG